MSATLERVRAACPGEGERWNTCELRDGVTTLDAAREQVHGLLAELRDAAGFAMPTLVTAVDLHPAEPRFELHWMLLSTTHGDRVRVRCRVSGDDPVVPSCTDLWAGAGYMERECFDMFGVRFEGNPDLRRLLMPEGFTHHPLRKEYPHHGIEPDRLYREWERSRQG